MSAHDGWLAFMREQAQRERGLRLFSQPPLELKIDPQCPDCGRADKWRRIQAVGETPGMPGAPASRGGEVWRCFACGKEYLYRDLGFTESEQVQRTAKLYGQARIGKVPL